ncbi:hypothetical protein NC651_012154 [Populus alba x Populus x berolinensis]|nr:hypothetical protein NC651_012154 [Populus alba x Populus x berolinensis]
MVLMKGIIAMKEALQGKGKGIGIGIGIGIEDVTAADTVVKCYIYTTMAFKAIAGLKQLPIANSYDPARERGHGRERDSDRDRDRYCLRDERDYGCEREREREREGRERERRYRDRGRQRRSLSRSRSRSRDRRIHAHSSGPKRHRDGAEEGKKDDVQTTLIQRLQKLISPSSPWVETT